MQKAPPHPNEAKRISALRALKVLDTPCEERFDRLTRLAKRLFAAPIALVSLVDADRQWFKSAIGIDATETPRDVSFCGHAILGDELFLVPDARSDPRFFDNPLVTGEPHVRFYAGYPLRASNGSKLGTLCVVDREPREFSDEDLALLHDLGRMAEQELAAVQLATMDDLTMLSNRRGFSALALHALGFCKRLEKPASLLYADLDEFKQINDRFGHAEGDRALKEFARLLLETFRESDVVGRLGGDEFAVLVTNAGTDPLSVALSRLREAVDACNRESGRGYDIAFSAGAVEYDPTRHGGLDELMAEADALMYERKRRRRSGSEAA